MTRLTTGVMTIAVVVAVGCGGSSASSTAGAGQTPAPIASTAPSAPTATQPAQQTTSNPPMSQTPSQTATAVDFERLVAFLPDPPAGWTRGKPKGAQIGGSVTVSSAEADYEKGDSLIHFEITDTAFDQTYLAPLSLTLAAKYHERNTSGYTKAAPIGGSPGFEKWDGDAKSAEVTMVVGNRIVVTAKGRNVENLTATRAMVASIDQSKLSALK